MTTNTDTSNTDTTTTTEGQSSGTGVSQEEFDTMASNLTRVETELATTKTKVGEFRSHNVALRQQIESAGGQVDQSSHTDVDTAINEAVKPIKDRNDALSKENATLQKTLEEVVLSDKVKDIAIKNGVVESALTDVVTRAKNVFTVKDGKTIPKDSKNRDADGNPTTPENWMTGLATDAPHLFAISTGSGARKPVGGKQVVERSSMQKIQDGLNQR